MVPGSEIGQVIEVPFRQWVTPQADNPLRFEGDVYVLVGPRTYSQAIVFAATVQDYDLAKIAGEETLGLANQTGQVTMHILPNSGLKVMAPLYIFVRPNGSRARTGVQPDIGMMDSTLEPELAVNALVEWHRSGTN